MSLLSSLSKLALSALSLLLSLSFQHTSSNIKIQPEELNVSRADDLLVLEQGLVALGLLLEQHEGVPGGAAVRLLDKQDPALLVQDVTSLQAVVKELNL